MQMADLYPPGRVFWARRDRDLPHSQRVSSAGSGKEAAKVRLFEVLDTEKVFSQIVFSKNMLRYVFCPDCLVLVGNVSTFTAPICPIVTIKFCTSCYKTNFATSRPEAEIALTTNTFFLFYNHPVIRCIYSFVVSDRSIP